MRWRRTVIAGAAALAVMATGAAGAVPARADGAVKPTADGITISGKGWGHGKGMSQYGAYGAAKKGLDWKEILDFYYPGTTRSTLPSGDTIRVWISSDTDGRTNVAPAAGLRLRDSGGKSYSLPRAKKYTQWRVGLSDGVRTLAYRNAAGTWVTRKSGLDPDQVWTFKNASTNKVTVVLPGGRRSYRGRVTVQVDSGTIRTVNVLPVETYLRSVVPAEMPASWNAEAVKAQSVAARSYAVRYRDDLNGKKSYDICDTASCQVYSGTSTEYSASDSAIKATAGTVLTYDDEVALTMFSSSNGGWSADGGLPYLTAHADPYDGVVTNQAWTVELSTAKIQQAYPSIGTLTSVKVTGRDGNGDWGGRVETIKVTGSDGSVTAAGTDFKRTFGLRETYFTIVGGN